MTAALIIAALIGGAVLALTRLVFWSAYRRRRADAHSRQVLALELSTARRHKERLTHALELAQAQTKYWHTEHDKQSQESKALRAALLAEQKRRAELEGPGFSPHNPPGHRS